MVLPILPADMVDDKMKYYVNPTGRFVIGGPQGDTGVTGRKIIVDTYGGYSRHGGGAFPAKTRPRSIVRELMPRAGWPRTSLPPDWLRNVRFRSLTPSASRRPLSVMVDTFGTGEIPDTKIAGLVDQIFDLRPGLIIKNLTSAPADL